MDPGLERGPGVKAGVSDPGARALPSPATVSVMNAEAVTNHFPHCHLRTSSLQNGCSRTQVSLCGNENVLESGNCEGGRILRIH